MKVRHCNIPTLLPQSNVSKFRARYDGAGGAAGDASNSENTAFQILNDAISLKTASSCQCLLWRYEIRFGRVLGRNRYAYDMPNIGVVQPLT